jgi:hypothetical protein
LTTSPGWKSFLPIRTYSASVATKVLRDEVIHFMNGLAGGQRQTLMDCIICNMADGHVSSLASHQWMGPAGFTIIQPHWAGRGQIIAWSVRLSVTKFGGLNVRDANGRAWRNHPHLGS